jgi:hypothetical protein
MRTIWDERPNRKVFQAVKIAKIAEDTQAELDPARPEDRQQLIKVVRETECNDPSSDSGNQAATLLLKAGYSQQLLEILAETSGYCVMGTIAQTLRETSLPVFEKRLSREPSNQHLIGALSNVQSKQAGPILIKALKMHSNLELIGPILHAVLSNKIEEALPTIKQRFADTPPTQEALKTEYALALLGLGDPESVSWLNSQLREETASGARTADGLVFLATTKPPFEFLADEGVLAPLLPNLAQCVSVRNSRDRCARILEVLTRHTLPAHGADWSQWLALHQNKHPIYSKPLDKAVNKALVRFRTSLQESGQSNPALQEEMGFLQRPSNSGKNFLWRFEVNPEMNAGWDRKRGGAFGLLFGVAMSSRLDEPKDVLFLKSLDSLNLTVILSSPNKESKEELIKAAEAAFESLQEYARKSQ